MFREIDYQNDVECKYMAQKLGLTEMQEILAGESASTSTGKVVQKYLNDGLLSKDWFQGFVTQLEEQSTSQLDRAWGV